MKPRPNSSNSLSELSPEQQAIIDLHNVNAGVVEQASAGFEYKEGVTPHSTMANKHRDAAEYHHQASMRTNDDTQKKMHEKSMDDHVFAQSMHTSAARKKTDKAKSAEAWKATKHAFSSNANVETAARVKDYSETRTKHITYHRQACVDHLNKYHVCKNNGEKSLAKQHLKASVKHAVAYSHYNGSAFEPKTAKLMTKNADRYSTKIDPIKQKD